MNDATLAELKSSSSLWLTLFPIISGGIGVNTLFAFLSSKKPKPPKSVDPYLAVLRKKREEAANRKKRKTLARVQWRAAAYNRKFQKRSEKNRLAARSINNSKRTGIDASQQ